MPKFGQNPSVLDQNKKQNQLTLPYKSQSNSRREFQINEATMKRAYFSGGGFATPNQLSFIKNLAAEKNVNKIFEATGIYIPENSIPTKPQAAAIIQKLMALD